ncbi:hypothetical protein ACFX2C_028638 [Malus domestica]
MSFSFRTVRRALPEVCLARPRSARQRLARASPRRKQKYDRYPQPTPFSQGSCVLVRQEIPAMNKLYIFIEFVGEGNGLRLQRDERDKRNNYKLF